MRAGGEEPPGRRLLAWQLLGLALFLFIPLVLFLFVRHPEPVGVSLAAGVLLMLGHRFVARPYMAAVRTAKCLWCNGRPWPEAMPLPLLAGTRELVAVTCPRHRDAAMRFLACLSRGRLPLRIGIFVPLLLLLGTLLAAALGRRGGLDLAVALFQLLVGLTVSVAAWGYRWAAPAAPVRVPFPAHNLFLLGVRNLLWIFRLVGAWWVVRGALGLLGR